MNRYSRCVLCPRMCKVNRSVNLGICKSTDKCKIARAALHYWEEPCISGKDGSGTIFFTGCTLGCVFCQNYDISGGCSQYGVEADAERLTEIFYELKAKGANNINFVTPTHFMPHIKEAMVKARSRGFDLPFVYNTSGYENVEILKELEGLVDIYLPDFKYFDDTLAVRYSKVDDYFYVTKKAVDEMVRQTGSNIFGHNGIMKKGVIVRHMILPGHTKDSMKIMEYLYETYGNRIYISIMNQYTPMKNTGMKDYPEIGRSITDREYNKVIDYALDLGIENAYIQEGDTCKESFIPDFNREGCLR